MEGGEWGQSACGRVNFGGYGRSVGSSSCCHVSDTVCAYGACHLMYDYPANHGDMYNCRP